MTREVSFDFRNAVNRCMMKDRYRFRRQWRSLRGGDESQRERLQRAVEASMLRAEQRRQNSPDVSYDDALPVVQKKEAIAELIRAHQVVIVAGETGSGKTTQLPKICLELGQGVYGTIGHTQPRRLAACSVASRIAEELKVEPGAQVGYQVRFADCISDQTQVKLMTDGILLAEVQNDRFLNQYDTLIIDEAHERSLNIDFLLGYLKLLLPKRPDLKLIITSATIDVARFSTHFDNAPVIEVSGRTYPVDVHYRSLEGLEVSDDGDQLLYQGIISAIREIESLEHSGKGRRLGDVLVFLSGEREIREAAQCLRDAKLLHTEILPLYARLSAAEQNRIFQPHGGRRIILSTNVAETSLTVPGIHYVIDPGFARISRYSVRSKVQRLPVEAISQASANQRKGRCGRIADGICFRLYDEEDFLNRPEFTDAEILRTNLAAVILKMLKMGLGDVSRFPFVDPPDNKSINDGFKLLHELGAVDGNNRITRVGSQLAVLPIDPRIGRMLIAAHETGAVQEVLVIASALSIQDPRERPADKRQAADQKHREFYDDNSDFLSLLNLWNWYEEQRQTVSQSRLRKLCKQQFLNFMRMREWRDMHRQLTLSCKDLGLKVNEDAAGYVAVHRALLAGLLSHLGNRHEEADYLGARNRKFWIFPGSALFKRKPKWVMAAELVETSRLYARNVAKVEPEWIEPLAGNLAKRNYFEPHWEKKRAQVVAYEQVTLYGLVIVARRKVHYGAIDPVVSRELFIREGLVEGGYESRAGFHEHNGSLIAEVEDLEAKSRRQDILVDPETLFVFYDELIPEEVCNGSGFEKWRKTAERDNARLLYLTKEYLMQHDAAHVTAAQYPDRLKWQGLELPLSYHFAPGEKDDGVTIAAPVSLLSRLPRDRMDWLVPGMLADKVIALIRALPKQVRKHFVPVPDYARAALEALNPCDEPLTLILGEKLFRMTGTRIPEGTWDSCKLDDHFRMNIRVLDDDGNLLGQGRDLSRLREQFADQARKGLRDNTDREMEREGLTGWSFGDLPEEMQRQRGGLLFRSYPGLVDEKSSVCLRLFDSPQLAQQNTRLGLARLIQLALPEQMNFMVKQLKNFNRITLLAVNVIDKSSLMDDFQLAVIGQVYLADPHAWPRTEAMFNQRVDQGRSQLMPVADELDAVLLTVFEKFNSISRQLKGKTSFQLALSMADVKQQLGELIYRGFLSRTPWEWLQQFPRYLSAVELRMEKLFANSNRDRVETDRLQGWREAWNARKVALDKQHVVDDNLFLYRWMLEEYRVSVFAQTLKTRMPVSEKRLRKVWEEIAQS